MQPDPRRREIYEKAKRFDDSSTLSKDTKTGFAPSPGLPAQRPSPWAPTTTPSDSGRPALAGFSKPSKWEQDSSRSPGRGTAGALGSVLRRATQKSGISNPPHPTLSPASTAPRMARASPLPRTATSPALPKPRIRPLRRRLGSLRPYGRSRAAFPRASGGGAQSFWGEEGSSEGPKSPEVTAETSVPTLRPTLSGPRTLLPVSGTSRSAAETTGSRTKALVSRTDPLRSAPDPVVPISDRLVSPPDLLVPGAELESFGTDPLVSAPDPLG